MSDSTNFMAVNMNIRCQVTLTTKGKQILRDYKDTNKIHDVDAFPVNSGVLECQLWELFLIFGSYCYVGCPPAFELNEINISI